MNYDLSFWLWAREFRSGECDAEERDRDGLEYEGYKYLEIIFES
jgi:hypothetical protein